jgi:hypothetical protein
MYPVNLGGISFLGPKNINSEISKPTKNLIVVVSARNLDMFAIDKHIAFF